jgi:hypothetical protein
MHCCGSRAITAKAGHSRFGAPQCRSSATCSRTNAATRRRSRWRWRCPIRVRRRARARRVDVDGITTAHAFLLRELARRQRGAFEVVETRVRPREPYAITPAQAGPRSLANVCLRYLGALDDRAVRALVAERFERADNMTDTIAALSAVKDTTSPERDRLFAHFEAKWRDEPLVLDKWFALEARSLRADTLARVRALLAHPRFNARNPNRVRALVGRSRWAISPASAADGAGYAFAPTRAGAGCHEPSRSMIAGGSASALPRPPGVAASYASQSARPVTGRARDRPRSLGD